MRQDYALVTVRVLDVNDNAPTFATLVRDVTIFDGSTPGTFVLAVTATDADAPGTDNSRITYLLDDPHTLFVINATTGAITVGADVIDSDTGVSDFTVFVSARDHGYPALTSALPAVRVDITVEDVNDNHPVYENTSAINPVIVPEDTVAGTPLAVLFASDADAGANGLVSYRIKEGPDASFFTVQQQFGAATVAVAPCPTALLGGALCSQPPGRGCFDYETKSAFSIEVEAVDGGLPQGKMATFTLNVQLTDVNECDPVIANTPVTCTVFENAASNTTCVTLQASDGDGSGNVVQFDLTGNTDVPFALQGNTLVATMPLNSEAIASYTLTVTATDSAPVSRTTPPTSTLPLST